MHRSLALVAALGAAFPAPTVAQIVPGYNVSFHGHAVSVVDIGGKPCIAILGKPNLAWGSGIVSVYDLGAVAPGSRAVELTVLWAGAFDPRPCAPGGTPFLRMTADVCLDPFPSFDSSRAVTIGANGYGFRSLPAPQLTIRPCLSTLSPMTWALMYQHYEASMQPSYATPCGADADLLQCIVCEVAIK